MQTEHPDPARARPSEDDDFVRLPGLFRRWEIEQVVDPGADFHLEEAGDASDGTPLFAVYWKRSSGSAANRSRPRGSLAAESDEARSRGARAVGLVSERQSAGSGRWWFEFLV
jgi:hypothetical protein